MLSFSLLIIESKKEIEKLIYPFNNKTIGGNNNSEKIIKKGAKIKRRV